MKRGKADPDFDQWMWMRKDHIRMAYPVFRQVQYDGVTLKPGPGPWWIHGYWVMRALIVPYQGRWRYVTTMRIVEWDTGP